MGLRIATNLASERVQAHLKQNSRKTDKSLEQLASGKRIISASDDAAGMAIANTMRAQTRSLRQAGRNANDGISMIQTAEGSLTEISNVLVRLRELSIQSASDTVGELERTMLNLEYQQLVSEIDRIADSTEYNGVQLINGEGKDLYDFHVGPKGGESNVIQFDASNTNVKSDSLELSGSTIEYKSDAADSIENIDRAITILSQQRAGLGAIQNRLHSAVSTIEIQSVQQDYARSIIEDVDVAEASSKLAKNTITKNAAIAALAQANSIPVRAVNLI